MDDELIWPMASSLPGSNPQPVLAREKSLYATESFDTWNPVPVVSRCPAPLTPDPAASADRKFVKKSDEELGNVCASIATFF